MKASTTVLDSGAPGSDADLLAEGADTGMLTPAVSRNDSRVAGSAEAPLGVTGVDAVGTIAPFSPG